MNKTLVLQAAKIIGIGKTAASQYIAGFKASGLKISNVSGMSDSELLNVINIRKESENPRYRELLSLFPYFEKELKRTGVTLQLLWQEYTQTHAGYYGYSQFCHHYYHWRKDMKVSMRMEHKAGDKMFVDFTGKKMNVTDPETGEIQELEVFVSVLGASQFSYIEAVASQKKADWITVNQNTLHFYAGVPAAIVPDCLKSAVIKSDKYEPQINETYNDFANHYQTVILPARALHPIDKYELKTFSESKVQYNHHVYIKEDKHYYSVPFQLTGKRVRIIYTSRTVDIYFNNNRVATHHRNYHAYGYTTKVEHRPPSHQYVSEWTPQRFIKWGRGISVEAEQVITRILDSRKHPEQAFKTCMGLLNLAKKYDRDDYIKACKKALQLNCTNYKFIKNTLKTKAFNLTDQQELELFKLPDHDNIRGKETYN